MYPKMFHEGLARHFGQDKTYAQLNLLDGVHDTRRIAVQRQLFMYPKMFHEGLARHFGQDKTYAQLSSFYFWPSMMANVKKFVEKCILCQYTKRRS